MLFARWTSNQTVRLQNMHKEKISLIGHSLLNVLQLVKIKHRLNEFYRTISIVSDKK